MYLLIYVDKGDVVMKFVKGEFCDAVKELEAVRERSSFAVVVPCYDHAGSEWVRISTKEKVFK